MLVMFEPGKKPKEVERVISNTVGGRTVHSSDYRKSRRPSGAKPREVERAYSFDKLGIAVVSLPEPKEAASAVAALASTEGVRAVRPEFWMRALDEWDDRYADWARDGLELLAAHAKRFARPPATAPTGLPAAISAQGQATWGIGVTRVEQSAYSGAGIKVAVLDTGLDLEHPAFAGRVVAQQSFVPNQTVQDVQGHGTHCIGTACGPRAPTDQIRYGVAYEAEIHVGKVLNNSGSGRESWILAGIEWAVDNGCEVISMSLGRPVLPNEPPDEFYENAGRYALENGSLIIAAAGNESWRQYGQIAAVGAPANAESVFSVGAIDAKMKIANFSCGGINMQGGEVNIAGPGVDILSTFPLPRGFERLSGTSMATPHVAGIAALYAQVDSRLRGRELWKVLERNAMNIGHPARDVGAGLVIAP
jgi:subtilisin family serine protease